MRTPFFLLFAASVFAASPEPPTLRLPDTAHPLRYSVDLTIVPGQDSFRGIIDIDMQLDRASSVIWMNATNLTIDQATLRAGGNSIAAKTTGTGVNFAGFVFDSAVTLGPATLHVVYEGKISKSTSAGLFQMRDGSRPPWYVYSQFEPTDARRAFPCFDEPKFKTPWQLTLHVKRDQFAASNTPILSETSEDGGMKRVTFAPTRPLPSYLVALAVGPFEAVDAGTAGRNRTPVRILVPRGRKGEAGYARAAIPEILKLLENYFDSPFPYPKLDSVIIPVSDFAMENAGLITYGASTMLARPEAATSAFKRECAVFAAHEMSHQWFGDLVTTSWWDDIWLNEAFASWMENKITGEWKPEWKMEVTEVQDRLGAMDLDSLASARRIRQPIHGDDDIANAFDGITYQKGAAVIGMFERWIGEKEFQKGVRLYMQQHADGSATTADFLAAVSQTAGHDIAPAFSTFLDQPGVPLLSVELDCGKSPGSKTYAPQEKPRLVLSQSRSLPIGSKAAGETWTIPVCVKYPAGGSVQHECEVLNGASSEMTLAKASSCPAWVLANDGEQSYYRVLYRGDLLERLLRGRGMELSVAERVGVLGDIRALVDSGDLTPARALAFVEPFSQDSDGRVVSQTISIASILRGPLVPDDLRANATRFLQKVYGAQAHQLGWNASAGEGDDTRTLRRRLANLIARDGDDPQLIAEARKLALRWLDDQTSVDLETADIVLSVAAAHGGQDLFDRIHAAALAAQDRHRRETLISAIGSFREPSLVKQRLRLLLTGEFDTRETFSQFLFPAPPEARDLPFQFVRDNLDALLKKLPREVGEDYAARLPEVGRAFCDASERAALEAFFKPRVSEYVGGSASLTQTLERIDLCIARQRALGPSLAAFLRGF